MLIRIQVLPGLYFDPDPEGNKQKKFQQQKF